MYDSSWGSVSGKAYMCNSLFETKGEIQFGYTWATNTGDGLNNTLMGMYNIDSSVPPPITVKFYNSKTGEGLDFIRPNNDLNSITKNNYWLHCENILKNKRFPLKIQEDLLNKKIEKSKLENK